MGTHRFDAAEFLCRDVDDDVTLRCEVLGAGVCGVVPEPALIGPGGTVVPVVHPLTLFKPGCTE